MRPNPFMPRIPSSPRPSRDPRVLTTGRENLRLMVLGFLGLLAIVGVLVLRVQTKAPDAAEEVMADSTDRGDSPAEEPDTPEVRGQRLSEFRHQARIRTVG